jgi:dolichyl-diphosphooligosaccharide--protein glycosyltransferase
VSHFGSDSMTTNESTSDNKNKPATGGRTFLIVWNSLALVGLAQILYYYSNRAYNIRLHAIHEYGRVIHEFDPYFNYRATEYLYAHGWRKFTTWFDTKVWYPLGRPVGSTIYPGMQVTSVLIKQFVLPEWSINDICCFVPAWFGVLATLAVAWLTYECVAGANYTCVLNDVPFLREIQRYLIRPVALKLLQLVYKLTGSDWGLRPRPVSGLTPLACAVAAAAIMSIVPAHLLRSVAGGYDNESIAMTAMVLTFACWVRSLKDTKSLWVTAIWGAVTGLAYFNMVAAWGGYVFVLNVIGVHAGFLVLLGRYSQKLHRAYSCFFIVGTYLAIQVPVVGWTPLKSLEQMGPLVGFLGLQLIEASEVLIRRRRNLSLLQRWKMRLTVFLSAGAVAAVVVVVLLPHGYFGPISSRVRGLFVEHTKTGNPLVDSVAEHQAASPQAYFQYLNNVMYLVPIGLFMTAMFFVDDSSSFLLVYSMTAYYFSHRMVRLILLTAPIASCLGGIVLGRFATWAFASIAGDSVNIVALFFARDNDDAKERSVEKNASTIVGKPKGTKKTKANGKTTALDKTDRNFNGVDPIYVKAIRLAIAAYVCFRFVPLVKDFHGFAEQMAVGISHPSIMQKAMTNDGQEVMIDDYREAYFWLRDNTDEDARVMAWWDYGT